MHSSNDKTKREYKAEDLPKFFKDRSNKIGKVFSSETIEISTIRSRSGDSNTQEFSFKLKLLEAVDKNIPNTILPQVSRLIDFFTICLSQKKSFKANITVSNKNIESYNNYCKPNNAKTVEEFINNAPQEILSQGITITLQTDITNINLDNLHEIESYLNGKLKRAKKTENKEQSEAKNAQNKQIVPIKGSFDYDVVNGKQITRTPVIVAAIRENVSWFRSCLRLPDFFNTIQFFFQQPPELPTPEQKALTDQLPKETKQSGVIQEDKIDEGKIEDTITLISDLGQTNSCTKYFEANRKKSKKQTKELSEEEKQLVVKQAQNDTRVALLNNKEGRKLDEIFVEVMNEYKDQDPETFRDIFNSVFNIVYFQDKQLHEVLESGEVLEVLQILERPRPPNNSLLGEEYLLKQVYGKKEQLLKLVSGIYTQWTTNIALRSPLKTVFSSKKTYFCLFLIASSISTFCLWHFPLEKVSILKGLVLPEKRESVGLTLNIGLPILIVLCVLSLAYFIYSEYSVESIEQVSKNESRSCT